MSQLTTAPDRRKRVAIHESGHAIAARLIGHTVAFVELGNGGRFHGRTQWARANESPDRTPPERAVIADVAGYVAEEIIFEDHDEDLCISDKDAAWEAAAGHVVWGDQAALMELKQMHDQGERVQTSQWPRLHEAWAVYQRLEQECRILLESHRADLDALAAYLEKHGRCEGEDIDAICDGTLKP